MWKETFVASVEVIPLQMPGGAEKIHVEPKPGKKVSLPSFHLATARKQAVNDMPFATVSTKAVTEHVA
jgi:surfactin synthase thioesterase subunit